MSKSEVLYMKGMNMSETEEEDNMESVWDDRKLTDAYDKALKIANIEVAKRVAMSTNTPSNKEENTKTKKEKQKYRPNSAKNKDINWKVGMPCRAIYEGDQIEYEAFVLRIINDKECIVRFIGYDNCEIVPMITLKASHGNDAMSRQIEQAVLEKADDGFGSQSPNPVDEMEASDGARSPESVDTSCQKKKRHPKKKNNGRANFSFEIPEIPMQMPNISMLRNLGSMEMPMPPPPMAFTSGDRTDTEDQAISSMLLSWYMSGYYTGLYQGLKRAKEGHVRRNV